MKDEFLAVMSHELKHPLNLIQVSAQMLMAMPEAQALARVQKAARAIQGSVKAQGRIIDDLLDLSRTRAGKLVLNRTSVYLAEALQSPFEWAAREAAAKRITFVLDVTDTSLLVDAEPVRLEQIAMNLLSNALKFTPAGGRITVRLSQEGDRAQLRVTDTGRGISPQFLPHVFGLFKQAETHTTRAEGGLGIGLALVQGLVLLHDGVVKAESDGDGRGSTFTVSLPLKQTIDFGALREDESADALAKMKILLVEDNADAREMFASLLEMEGAEVISADSGKEALSAADSHDFDLIISDIGMPVMDGYTMMAEMRKKPRAASVPSIALTGYGREQDVDRARAAGFTLHMNKPVDVNELKANIKKLPAT
jgi:two-component system, chemotaxis family, CheB/CheR fusion protein